MAEDQEPRQTADDEPDRDTAEDAADDEPDRETAEDTADDEPDRDTAEDTADDEPDAEPAKKTAKKRAKKAAKKRGGGSAPRAEAPKGRAKPLELARRAAEQLKELTGREPESITGIERTDDGWRIEIEVVETRRIPDSADILAVYEVEVDQDGELLGYRRLRRYSRGRTDPAEGGGR